MTVPTIPNPNNIKAIEIVDMQGGQSYFLLVTIAALNKIDTGSNLAVGGLQSTTAGVTDTTDKRFVTDQELADLITLQPLALLEAKLAQLGANLSETLLASVPSVNLNTATPTTLYTVPAGKSAIINKVVMRLASTSLTTASWSIGFNSAAFNDVLANATHTELTGATLYSGLAAKAGAKVGAAADVLKLLCNTLQGGAATATVDVYGYLY